MNEVDLWILRMDDKRPQPGAEDRAPDATDELTAELVAYLDGELDPQRNEAVSAKISINSKVRAEADSLKRTWDLLDHLPRPEPSPNFTERTLSRIEPLRQTSPTAPTINGLAPAALRTSSTAPIPMAPVAKSVRQRLISAALWTISIFGLAGAGFVVRGQIAERLRAMDEREQDAKILSERRLLQNLRAYRHVDDLEFLEALDSPDLFGVEQAPVVREEPK